MFGIDDTTAVAVMPTPEAAGTPGFFTEGNPALGQAATYLRASFLNSLMTEVLNVGTAGAITPVKTTYTQLIQALRRLYGGNFSTVTSGTTSLNFDRAGIVLVDATGGNVVMNLPASAGVLGLPITFRRIDTSANTVTVNCAGADVLDVGLLTSFTMVPGELVKLRSNGVSAWIMEQIQRARFARLIANANWVAPWYVTTAYYSGCGGGGGGGGGGGATNTLGVGGGGAGGGCGQSALELPVTVTPNTSYPVVIGTGGTAGSAGAPSAPGGAGGNGSATTFASQTILPGGGGSGGVHWSGAGTPSGGTPANGNPNASYGKDGAAGMNGGVGNGGMGSSSAFGGGGGAGRAGTTGVNGVSANVTGAYGGGGGGGGGGYGSTSSGASGGSGGAGAGGILIIRW